jgi:WD40 repeat protein
LHLLSLPDGCIAFTASVDEGFHLLILDFNDKYNIDKLFIAQNDKIYSRINLNNNRFACATTCSGIMILGAGNNGYIRILKEHNDDSTVCLLYINEYDELVSGSVNTIEVWDIMNNYGSIYSIKEGALCLLYLPNGYLATSN